MVDLEASRVRVVWSPGLTGIDWRLTISDVVYGWELLFDALRDKLFDKTVSHCGSFLKAIGNYDYRFLKTVTDNRTERNCYIQCFLW
jgi:hypothetical protein